jgi:hypothetical protein
MIGGGSGWWPSECNHVEVLAPFACWRRELLGEIGEALEQVDPRCRGPAQRAAHAAHSIRRLSRTEIGPVRGSVDGITDRITPEGFQCASRLLLRVRIQRRAVISLEAARRAEPRATQLPKRYGRGRRKLLHDEQRLAEMSSAMLRLARPDAADEIAEELLALTA